MAVTRAKATSLLNATEMGLYDDSRANALRGHSETKLARLVTRARTARDRARDLEKRQRLASRSTTGSKSGRSGQANARTGEKVELLADILKRLEAQHRETAKAEKAAARDKAKTAKSAAASGKTKAATAAKPASGKKATTKTSAARTKAGAGKAAAASTTSKTPSKKAPAKRTSSSAAPGVKGKAATKRASKTATKATTKKSAAESAGISPKRALANTRKLLAQQEAKAAQPKPWDGLGNEGTAQSAPGFQSPKARSRVLELHAGETRQAPIHGSISTRDRKNQGKRDHRSK